MGRGGGGEEGDESEGGEDESDLDEVDVGLRDAKGVLQVGVHRVVDDVRVVGEEEPVEGSRRRGRRGG